MTPSFTRPLAYIGILALFPSFVIAETSDPNALRDALVGYSWSWNSPQRKVRMRFLANGTATFSDGRNSTWNIEGHRKVALGDNCTLNFNESLTSFTGFNRTRKWKLSGERQEPAVKDTPAPNPSPELVAAPAPSPLPAAPEMARESTPKSTLEALAGNGPFITDQVLSALDMPSVSEATVSLWKEDLLDEAAKMPATAQPVYRQAAAVLDAWKSALRERYQIISTSQFSGAVIDAPDMASGRKTVLHLWDWLEYARERDAAARHEQKLKRTADFFASGPPRRWAERSAALRLQIERLYSGFRQLKRTTTTPAPSSVKSP